MDEVTMGELVNEDVKMPYEDEESMAVLLQAYNEAGYLDEEEDYESSALLSRQTIVLNVASELSKMQSEIVEGELRLIRAEDDKTILIEEGYMGVISNDNLTKSDVASRFVAIKFLSSLVYKCMEIVNEDKYSEIEGIREEILNFQHDLEDGDKNEVVRIMVKDLATVS